MGTLARNGLNNQAKFIALNWKILICFRCGSLQEP